MTASAIQVTIIVGEFRIDAYQLNDDGKTHLLFTHRQIGEIIGKTKATAFCFLKKHAASISETIKASIPSRKGTFEFKIINSKFKIRKLFILNFAGCILN